MYNNRNKIMIIFSVMIAAFLCFLIWSSNLIAENEAQKREEEQQAAQPIEVGIPIQHAESLEAQTYEEEVEEEDTDGELEPYEVDTTYLEPIIESNVKTVNTTKTTYTQKVLTSKPLILWNQKSFPLKVHFVDSANYPERFLDEMKHAFDSWTSNSNNFVSFTYVDSASTADIVVQLTDKADNCEDASCHSRYKIDTTGSTLKKAYIYVPQINCEDKPLTSNDVAPKLQHDIGHVLGIAVHSDDTMSTMYPKLSDINTYVTTMDARTLEYLYMFLPDISNIPYTQDQKRKLAKASDVQELRPREFDAFIQERLPELQLTQRDKMALTAHESYANGNYQRAISAAKKVLAITEKDDSVNLANMYQLLAMSYLQEGDAELAYTNAIVARDTNSCSTTRYLLAYVQYQTGRYGEAEAQIDELLKKYPNTTQAYSLLGLVYIKQGRWVKAQEHSEEMKQKFPKNPPFVVNYVPESTELEDNQ